MSTSTLPADFFTKKKKSAATSEAPATLPADFFSGKKTKPEASSTQPDAGTPPAGVPPAKAPTSGPLLTPPPPKEGAEEGTLPKALRGAELGTAHGLGIPETQTPISDLWKGITLQGLNFLKRPDLAPGDQVVGMAQNIYDSLKEIYKSRTKENPEAEALYRGEKGAYDQKISKDSGIDVEHFTHGLASLITQIMMVKGVKEALTEHVTTVDGGLKAAEKITKGTKASDEAVVASHKLSNGAPNRILQRKVFEDAYVHAKGLDLAKKVDKAAKSVQEEIAIHADGIAKQIDTKIPTGVVNASAEAANILKEFQDVVKTPEKAHPALVQMVKDAAATPPKLWSWEKTRQFRSSIGRAIGKTEGPQKVVLTREYISLTNKLGGAAKKYGLGKSWEQYNELAMKMDKEFGDMADDVKGAKSGQEVSQKLGKDVALSSEFSKNLAKYGLNQKEVLDYIRTSKRIAAAKNFVNRSLFRVVWGSAPGFTTAMSLKMAGAPYIGAMGGGFLVGMGSSYLVSLARVLRLSPEIIEHMMKERELPGKMKFEPGTFPGEETPPPPAPKQLPAPSEPPRGTPPGAAPPPKPSVGETQAEQDLRTSGAYKGEERRVGDVEPEIERRKMTPGPPKQPKVASPEVLAKERAEGQAKLAKEGGVTKVEPGAHGTGKLAEQSKARERVTKARKEKGPTAAGGGGLEVTGGGVAEKAQLAQEAAKARASASNFDVTHLQIPEMEEWLREKYPKEFKSLIKMRKAGNIPDVEWKAALEYAVLHGLEEE